MKRGYRIGFWDISSEEVFEKKYQWKFSDIKKEISKLGVYGIADKPREQGYLEGDIDSCTHLIFLRHCEFQLPYSDIQIKKILAKTGKISVDYFFGGCQDSYDPITGQLKIRKRRTKNSYWFSPYAYSLLCLLLIEDTTALNIVAKWPLESLTPDMGYSNEDVWFYVVLGNIIRGKSWDSCSRLIKKINAGHRRMPKTLLHLLESVVQNNTITFERQMVNFMPNFIKYSKREQVDLYQYIYPDISVEASIFWNIARIRGMNLPSFSNEIMDRIITPQSIGLTK
jgi:hypothetical protein